MNQHRWNCLTALFISTIVAPTSSVQAQVQTPAVSEDNYVPRSLPQVTSLTAKALQANAVVSDPIQLVPPVSTLPIVTPFGKTKNATLAKLKIAKAGILTQKIHSQLPITPVSSTTTTFSSTLRATAPILSIPNQIESSPVSVNAVAPLPQIAAKVSPTSTKSFTSQATSAPIFVSRSDNSKLTPAKILGATIINSATVQAEIAATPLPDNSISLREGTVKIDAVPKPTAAVTNSLPNRSEVTAVPQVAPIASYPRDRVDIPSFEAGLPVFIFENDRPQQIVATAIAQVGDEIVAPEPSIAIPVERPKQSIIPTRLPASTPSIAKIVPSATQPVLNKIVSTQTGQASWYGAESGNRTASGESFNPRGLTAAHLTLPFGTMVKVTSLKTGKAVVVRINDRGPFRSRRMIDISAGAAEVIGLKNDGVGDVRMDILDSQG